MSHHARSRSAFTISPLIVLLTLALIGLLVWRVMLIVPHLQPRSGVYGTSFTVGVYLSPVIMLAVCIGIAGGVGAAAYFMFGRSETAANLGMGLTLLIPIGIYSYSNYTFATAGPASPTAAPPNPAAALMKQAQDARNQASLDAQRLVDQQRQQHERLRQPIPSPVTNPAPAPSNTDRSAPVTPTPRPTLTEPKSDPKVQATLDDIKNELDEKVSAFLKQADAAFELAAKTPRANKKDLEDRQSALAEFRSQAGTLEAYFNKLDDYADQKLADAGVNKFDARGERIRWSADLRMHQRAFVCNEYERFADVVSEYNQLLLSNAGKWRVDGASVTTTDTSLKHQLSSIRSRLDQKLARKGELADNLRGR